jgi:hypothetical protein
MGARAELALDAEPEAVLRVPSEILRCRSWRSNPNLREGLRLRREAARLEHPKCPGDVRERIEQAGLLRRRGNSYLRLYAAHRDSRRLRPAPARPRRRPRRIARRVTRTSGSRGDPHLGDDPDDVAVSPSGVTA